MSCGMDFSNFPLYDSQICPLLLLWYNDIARGLGSDFGCIITAKFKILLILQKIERWPKKLPKLCTMPKLKILGIEFEILFHRWCFTEASQKLEYFMSHGQKKILKFLSYVSRCLYFYIEKIQFWAIAAHHNWPQEVKTHFCRKGHAKSTFLIMFFHEQWK